MGRLEILQALDKLMVELTNKTLEYSDCVRRDATLEVKRKIRFQLKDIEKRITELKEELAALTANQPNDRPVK
ncbi:MAG: hypothetical protein JWM28_1543 [Chitinophagaceae bacterium]|nr:hypothetical protein [Chitinophagaceae bacterium]